LKVTVTVHNFTEKISHTVLSFKLSLSPLRSQADA
jgi:hypothetical protein